jgi:hypothetical protein
MECALGEGREEGNQAIWDEGVVKTLIPFLWNQAV